MAVGAFPKIKQELADLGYHCCTDDDVHAALAVIAERKRANLSLSPCPFCGETAAWEGDSTGEVREVWVICRGCGIRTPSVRYGVWDERRHDLQRGLIEKWNQRKGTGR